MTGRLQLIEQKLHAIDSAGFQNLCDTYLLLREEEFISFNRTGSQSGKQKTVKGTPDTFFRLANRTLGFVEHTTQADQLSKKIQEDIDKCLDESKTGVSASEVHKITVCFNSRLDTGEEAEIIKYAQSKSISVELVGIDQIAIEICSKYLILARDFLGMPLDSGQVLPIHKFVEEYNNKGGKLATPIDNIFLHRVTELGEVEERLKKNNLLIFAGAPGVGKTKLGIESTERFCKANPSYQAYAIAKKDVDIHADLKILLQSDKDYIILVDDANRQLPNLLQILGLLAETRKGNLKLILTVRSYALEDITGICHEYAYESIEVEKFSDEEIKALISSDSFKIRNPRYQQKIIEISDGNARLAVMAAKVAQDQQEKFLWGDVSDLYDLYFERFIKDVDLTKDQTLLKTLGLVSFFFSIDRNNREFVTNLLKYFDIDYYKFNEAVDELHKRELVEVQYNIVRVADQILATYIFYKVFVKEQILAYRTLLDQYFPKWKTRFRDTIIPANNSFGYESVLGKIDTVLNDYLTSIYSDTDKVMEFFSLFWFYKPTETQAYFHKQIKALPEPENPLYTTGYETNQFSFGRDKTLDFLSNFFQHNTEHLVSALELSFEYCRKKPEALPDLIEHIRSKFRFDQDDESTRFERQYKLFDLLRKKALKKEPHYVSAFFALSKTFLSRYYQVTKGGRNHSIVFYDYPLQPVPVIKEFRRLQWKFLRELFDQYPDEILDVLDSFKPHHRDDRRKENKLLAFDLTFVVPFIEQKLNPATFAHIHFVHALVLWLDREKLTDRSYQRLRSTFYNAEYEDFLKLDWNRLRDKEIYDFDDHQEYVVVKTAELRNSFMFSSPDDFKRLHKAIANLVSIKENVHSHSESLDIIIEENFIKNNQLGFDLFESIIANYPANFGPLHKSVKAIVSAEASAKKLLKVLKAWEHPQRTAWLLMYFDMIPAAMVNPEMAQELLGMIDSIDTDMFIWFETFEKFEAVDNKIFEKILVKVVDKIEKGTCLVRFSHDFFEKYAGKFVSKFDLLGKAYLQQEEIQHHGDIMRRGLKQLVSMDPKFLLAYVDKMYVQKDEHRRETHNQLNFTWDLNVPDGMIEEAVNMLVGANLYLGILEHPVGIFFLKLTETQEPKAKKFILQYITKYATDSEKMNAIFDAIRHYMKSFHEEAFHHFLSQNQDVNFFKEIWWRGNGGGVHSGDVNFGELEQADWMTILASVEKYPNQFDVLPIKGYLKEKIARAIKWAEVERQRRFANPDWPF